MITPGCPPNIKPTSHEQAAVVVIVVSSRTPIKARIEKASLSKLRDNATLERVLGRWAASCVMITGNFNQGNKKQDLRARNLSPRAQCDTQTTNQTAQQLVVLQLLSTSITTGSLYLCTTLVCIFFTLL